MDRQKFAQDGFDRFANNGQKKKFALGCQMQGCRTFGTMEPQVVSEGLVCCQERFFLVPDNTCWLVWHLTLVLAKELIEGLLFHSSLSWYIPHFVLFLLCS